MSTENLRKVIRQIILTEARKNVKFPKEGPYGGNKPRPSDPEKFGNRQTWGTADHHAQAGISARKPKERKSTRNKFKNARVTGFDAQERYNDAYGRNGGTVDQKWTLQKRKWIKGNWADRVHSVSERRQFFSEGGPIDCLHFLGMYKPFDLQNHKRLLDLHLAGNPTRHELSCVGFVPVNDNHAWFGADVAIQYNKREITWASAGDVGSEFLSSASEELKQFHAQTGLKKYPSSLYSADSTIFSQEDWQRMNLLYMGEVIIGDVSNAPADVIIHINENLPQVHIDELIKHIRSIDNNYQVNIS